MNKREIAVLSFKVLSLYSFIEAISKLSDVIYHVTGGIHDETFIINILLKLIPLILLILFGVLLWFIAPLLTTNIFKFTLQEDKAEISSVDIPIIAFSVVGLCLLATALPNIVEFILVYHSNLVTPITESNIILIQNFIVFLLKSALGLWLLFDSRRIVNYIYRARRDDGGGS